MLTEHKQIANAGIRPSRHGLEAQGFRNLNVAYWNLGTAQLLEHAIQRREGNLRQRRLVRSPHWPVHRAFAQR